MSSSTDDRLSAYLANPDSQHAASLTAVTVYWPGSGLPASGWHDEVTTPPTVTFDKYLWNSTTIADPANRTLTLGSTFTDNLNGFVINANSHGYFALDFTASLQGSADQMYRHGRDWIIELDYVGGSVTCHTDLRGRYGPVIQPTVPAVVNWPTFTVSADASDPEPAGSITQVYFEVYSIAGGVPVYTKVETTAPYCLGGKSGGVCIPISSYVWPNGIPIDDGETYTITLRARDNDPHQQYTRVVRTMTVNQPAPTSTGTSTPTATPTATVEPTLQHQVYLPLVEKKVTPNNPKSPAAIDIVRNVIEILRYRLLQL